MCQKENKAFFRQMRRYSSIYNIYGQIRPTTFGNTVWPLDGIQMHFSKFEFFLPTLHRICQGRFSFPNIVPHSPIHVSLANLPLILQFYFICQFASHSPICLSVCQKILFTNYISLISQTISHIYQKGPKKYL